MHLAPTPQHPQPNGARGGMGAEGTGGCHPPPAYCPWPTRSIGSRSLSEPSRAMGMAGPIGRHSLEIPTSPSNTAGTPSDGSILTVSVARKGVLHGWWGGICYLGLTVLQVLIWGLGGGVYGLLVGDWPVARGYLCLSGQSRSPSLL